MTDTTCVVAGCDSEPCNGRGWCWKHYTRWRRGQRVEDPPFHLAITEFLDTSGGPDACWEWQGARHWFGYGRFRQGYVHRYMLGMVLGRDLMPSECACHHCDNPPCANPRHLFVGTPKDNALDREAKGRGPRVEVDCDAIRWLYMREVRPEDIAEAIGAPVVVVRRRVKEMGLPQRRSGRPSNRQREQARRALAAWAKRGAA